MRVNWKAWKNRFKTRNPLGRFWINAELWTRQRSGFGMDFWIILVNKEWAYIWGLENVMFNLPGIFSLSPQVLLKLLDVVTEKTLKATCSITAARGRGKSAALGTFSNTIKCFWLKKIRQLFAVFIIKCWKSGTFSAIDLRCYWLVESKSCSPVVALFGSCS